LEGRIVARAGKFITIQPPLGGRETILATNSIKEIRPRSTSIMPERLLDKMADQQIQDIFLYIIKTN